MEFEKMNHYSDENFDESVNLREIVDRYSSHFKWFVISILFFIGLAFIKLYYEIPQYEISSSILIKEKDEGSSFVDLSSFEELGLFGSGDNSLENEIQILNSRRLMTNVVNELKLNIRYFIENSPYNKEQYPNFPITVSFKSDSSSINKINTNFQILVKSNKRFELIDFDGNSKGERSFGQDFKADLGDENSSNERLISIEINNKFNNNLIGKKIIIKIRPVNVVVNSYQDRLEISPINEKLSEVLILKINDVVIEKGIALINNLIEQYNADDINDKNQISQTTTDFLDSRIELISVELEAIEGTAEQFKTRNRMVDTSAGTDIFLQSSSVNESDLIASNTQLQLVNYMLDELHKVGIGELLPSNIGLTDPVTTNLIGEFNNLILERNRILKSSSTINPIIVGIDSQLDVLKNNLISSLKNLKSSLQIQIDALNKQGGRINSRIASVPKNEREYKDIVRQQETKNALYLFLLQKREESILSNAVSIEKAKIIDNAYSNGNPISPKKMLTYLGSIIFGMLLPFSIIYIKDLLDTKVRDEKDINKLRIPYLGDVPLAKYKNQILIKDNDNSNIAEAFRYVRTNIGFMLDNKEMGKTIFVTSTQSHEGKTVTAINLAFSLAISGKKTLLLAMDLRAPRISKYLDLEDMLGVTNFIKNDELTVHDIIDKYTNFDYLDIINSGDIPPNPVELLMNRRVNEIFEEVKEQYEYIIVDTAPVGMVTDALQISKFSDLTIYIIKANYLDKRMLHIPEKLYKENKLPNMALMINESDHSKSTYGYGYGYGNKKKKPWYRFS